jgi:hypothetical protein
MGDKRPRPWGTWIMWLKRPEGSVPLIVTLHEEGTANSTPSSLFGGWTKGPCMSTLHDVWQWSGEHAISTACVAFLFAPSGGAPLGWLRVRGSFEIDGDGSHMHGKSFVDFLACTPAGGWPDPLEPGARWQVAPNTPPEGLEVRFERWRLGPAGPLATDRAPETASVA